MDTVLFLTVAKTIGQIVLLRFNKYWMISLIDLCAFYILLEAPIIPFLIIDEDFEWKEL